MYLYAAALTDSLEPEILMIHANFLLKISKGIFVYSEIKIHTIHEGNYTVIKLPRNGNSKAKKINKNNSVHGSYQTQLMGWNHLMIYTQVIHS